LIAFRSPARFDKSAVILICEKEALKGNRSQLSGLRLPGEVMSVLKSGRFTADNGELFPVLLKGKIILLVGAGKSSELSMTALRTAVRKALLSPFLNKIKDIEIIPYSQAEETIRAVIEAAVIGGYVWRKYITKDQSPVSVDTKNIFIATLPKRIYQETLLVCQGVNFSRNLVNDNADTVNSAFIEKTVRGIIKGKRNLSISVLNRKELKAKGLNLHLAVNQGSRNEPKLIFIKYNGAGSKEGYTAMIGKGITFDTGGLNLKPTGSIETMRTDMSGAAAVIGVLKNTIALNLKKNILFVCALAENAIGSGAYKPGDVLTGYSGTTVEIANTDAEGRLVLADALAYTVKNYKPKCIIDIATLTGACVVALGHDYSGLMSNDDSMAEKFLALSRETDDRVWRLPIYPELKDAIKSQIADIKNTGLPKGAAGTCSAAEFLRQFVGETKWLHLDIAGTAFADNQGRLYFGYGATGAGVRLLTEYLRKN